MNKCRFITSFGLCFWLGLAVLSSKEPTARAKDASSQPSATAPARTRPGPMFVVNRIKQIVNDLDLSDQQQPKLTAIFNQATIDANALGQQLMDVDDPQERTQKVTAFARLIRQKIADVLSADQLKSLDQKFANAGIDRGPARAFGALQTALEKLDLSDDQKSQIKDLLATSKQKISDIRDKGGDNTTTEIQQVRQDIRKQLAQILEPDQIQTLQHLMQDQLGPRGDAARKAPPATENSVSSQQGAETESSPTTRPALADLRSTGPDVGDPAPDIKILELNGHTLDPAAYKGRVIVLEFGSLSCPVFRDQVSEMEKLKAAEGSRAFFMVVYTREAFPAGTTNVERNKTAGIAIDDPLNLEARKALAERAQRELNITLPMGVDSMDDAAAKAFGALANSAVVIGKDGKIAARELWTNPQSLRRAIDQAIHQQ